MSISTLFAMLHVLPAFLMAVLACWLGLSLLQLGLHLLGLCQQRIHVELAGVEALETLGHG